LQNIAALLKVKNERDHSLCCGGSLGNLQISTAQRTAVQKDVVARLSVDNPDIIVTACPSCKKTLNIASPVPVKDIAEIFVQSLEQPAVLKHHVFEKEPLQKVKKEEIVVSYSNK
ncbi:MAG: heterodisulfide reductase-related iron-sulfur binding cluster, partial [Bacteroidota bacterium]|nr:heterodisulfide reductase-related iron-sulfur binding cluster [Bacteroidota bacterium]